MTPVLRVIRNLYRPSTMFEAFLAFQNRCKPVKPSNSVLLHQPRVPEAWANVWYPSCLTIAQVYFELQLCRYGPPCTSFFFVNVEFALPLAPPLIKSFQL